MNRPRLLTLLLAALIPVSAVSCDGEGSPFTEASFPLCEGVVPGGLRGVGTIDGTPIDVTLPTAGGGLTQIEGGEVQYQGNHTSDPTMPDLRLSWPESLLSGDVGEATGFVRLMDGPFAGQDLCVGAGTQVRIPKDDRARVGMFQFRLTDLRSGEDCSIPHTGELRGCLGD